MLSFSLLIPFVPWAFNQSDKEISSVHQGAFLITGSVMSFAAELLVLSSLFAWERPYFEFNWRFVTLSRNKPESCILPMFFITLNVSSSLYSLFVTYVTQELLNDSLIASLALSSFLSVLITTTALTVGIGGQWLHNGKGWSAWQPGRGGINFVLLQAIGWTLFAVVIAVTLVRILDASNLIPEHIRYSVLWIFINSMLPAGAVAVGVLGVFAEIILATSLFVFQEDEFNKARRFFLQGRKMQRQAWYDSHTGLEPEIKAKILSYL